MFDKNAIKQGFSSAAQGYDEHAKLQAEVRAKALELAADYFPSGATIIDIGCGTGTANNWEFVGLDISYGMCKVAKSKNPLVINADAALLPLKNKSFDGIFSSLFLQWAQEPEIIIKEILRVLKPGGTAVITTFVHGTLSELEEAFKAVDSAPHISNFSDTKQLMLKIAHIGGMVLKFEEEVYTEYHDTVKGLMLSIKNIGASNKLTGRRKGLMTARQLAKVAQAYKTENGKYPASWKVLTMVLGKM